MSRRRATELPLDEEAQIPMDSNSKARATSFQVGRFIRTRPAAAVLVMVAFGAVSILALSVLRTLLSFAGDKQLRSQDGADALPNGGGGALGNLGTASKFDTAGDADGDGGAGGAGDAAVDGDGDRDDKPADGAGADAGTGTAAEEGGNAAVAQDDDKAAEEGADHSANTTATCIRKLEAGRFGSKDEVCVTADYYMDISIGSTHIGRVKMGIFGQEVPKSAANWHALATCKEPFDESSCFHGDSFHRIVRGFVIQGGSKATGRSIWGGTFREQVSEDHHSVLSHSETGVMAWAEYPIGSQFYIVLAKETKYLDKNHVVFGYVHEDSMDLIRKIEYTNLDKESPVEKVTITDSGLVQS